MGTLPAVASAGVRPFTSEAAVDRPSTERLAAMIRSLTCPQRATLPQVSRLSIMSRICCSLGRSFPTSCCNCALAESFAPREFAYSAMAFTVSASRW